MKDDKPLSENIGHWDGGDYWVTAGIWRTRIQHNLYDTFEVGIRNKETGGVSMSDPWIEHLLAEAKDISKPLWPCIVVTDRYGGAYSGGKFLAFRSSPGEKLVEEAINGRNDFWECDERALPEEMIGKGDSLQSAYDDLRMKWINWLEERLKRPS